MKKLLAVLFILLVPGLSIAGEEIVVKSVTSNPAPRNSALPDIFFDMAHTCATFTVDCLPSNVLSNPVAVYIKVYVPSTQLYTRYYFVTDIQGAAVGFFSSTGSLDGGTTNDLSVDFSLPTGQLYRFFAILVGADGRLTVSDSYTFKVV
jgi:hypothetical protein